jgi:hypothetical protein
MPLNPDLKAFVSWLRPALPMATERKLWRIWLRRYNPVDPRRPTGYFGLILADEKTASFVNEGMRFFFAWFLKDDIGIG